MEHDPRLQRAFDRIELVGGTIGNPDQGRLCVMSLVAFLAGEEHSDAPRCASPVIQTFAVLVNDRMPQEARQRLKPFAPRIIGTDDGRDGARADLLRSALAREVLPRAVGQGLVHPAALPRGRFLDARRLWRWLRTDERQRLVDCALSPGGDAVATAGHAARLIARLASHAPDARAREWYWDAAIGILDRLCGVGAPTRRAAGVRAERVARLEGQLPPRPGAVGRG
jgi:hypothetical protein